MLSQIIIIIISNFFLIITLKFNIIITQLYLNSIVKFSLDDIFIYFYQY